MKSLVYLFSFLLFQNFSFGLDSIPYYFGVKESAVLSKLGDENFEKIYANEITSKDIFLRVKKFKGNTPKERHAIFDQLLKDEIIQTGDIVLSFRPNWASTVPYSHLQMGISHSGIAYVVDGIVYNLDMPLDVDYNGGKLNGRFDSKHYLETPYIHIVRPRHFGLKNKNNLKAWILNLQKNYASIKNNGLLKFNADYSQAKIDKYSNGYDFVTTMSRILLGQDKTSKKLTMFCSEFAWAILSLSNCNPTDKEFGNKNIKNAACIKPIFEPMFALNDKNNLGLATGPLTLLKSLDLPVEEKIELKNILFNMGDASSLSSGHNAIATHPFMPQLLNFVDSYYSASLANAAEVTANIESKLNKLGGRNYSPTSFFINTLMEESNPERKFDYVATIIIED